MTPNDVMADLDEQIRRDAQALAEQALAAGWRADELAVVLRPWLQSVAAARARALERINRSEWHSKAVH